MKNIFKKNSIIITALAIMIVIAGYLSFTTRDAKNNDGTVPVSGQNEVKDDKGGKDVATTDKGTNDADNDATTNNTTGDDTDITDTDTGDSAKNDTNGNNELGSKDSQNVADNGELDPDNGTPGEAVLASTADADYFTNMNIKREQLRAKNKSDLMEIINSTKATAADKKQATTTMVQLISNSDKEEAAEMLLGAKGFSNAIVFINNGKADVAVNAKSLTKQQTAIIEDVVKNQTGISVEHMSINPYVLEE